MSTGGGADFNHHIAEAFVTLKWKDEEYYRGLDKAKARLDAFIKSASDSGLSAQGRVNDAANATARLLQSVNEAKNSIGKLGAAVIASSRRMKGLLEPVAGQFSGVADSVGKMADKVAAAKKNTEDLTKAARDLKGAMGGSRGWNFVGGGGMGAPRPRGVLDPWGVRGQLQLPGPSPSWRQLLSRFLRELRRELSASAKDFRKGFRLGKDLSNAGLGGIALRQGIRDLLPRDFVGGVRALGRPVAKWAGEQIQKSRKDGLLKRIDDRIQESHKEGILRDIEKSRRRAKDAIADIMDDLNDGLDKAKRKAKEFREGVRNWRRTTGRRWQFEASRWLRSTRLGRGVIAAGNLSGKVTEAVAPAIPHFMPRNFSRGVGTLAGLSASVIGSLAGKIGDVAKAAGSSALKSIKEKVSGAVSDGIGAIKGKLGGLIGSIVTAPFRAATVLFKGMLSTVGNLLTAPFRLATGLFKGLASTIGNLILTPVRMATGLVKGLFYASGISGVLAAVGSIKTATHSENVGALLQRITGGSAKDTEGLMRSLRGSAQKTPGVALERYYEVAETGARMGLPIEQLKAFSDGMTKVGIVLDETELPLKEAANRIGSLISVFRGSSEDAAKYGSALVKLDQMSTASAREILDVANRFSGSAATFNMKPHETLALAAALRQARVPTETAGTAPGQILMRMASQRDMSEFAKVAGMEKGAFKELLEGNTYQAIKRVVGGLVEIEDKLGAVAASRAMDKLHLDGQRVRSAMLQLGQVVGLMDEYLEAAGDEWENQAEIQRGVEIASRTLSAQWELLATELKSIAIEAGRGFMPMLKGMVIGFRNLSERIRGFIEENGPTLDEWGRKVQTVFEAIGTVWEKWPSFLELAQVTLEEKLELARLTVEEKLLKVKDLFDDLKDYAVKRMGEAAASIKEMINPANLVAAAGGAIKRSAWRFGEKAMNWALGGRWESVMDPSPPNAKPGFFGRTFGTSDEDRRNRLAEIERQKEEVRRKGEDRRAKPIEEIGRGIGENRFKDWVNTHQPQIKSMKDIVAGVKRDPNAVVKIIRDEALSRLGNLGRAIASPFEPVVNGIMNPSAPERIRRGADTFAGRQWERNRARRMAVNAAFSRQRDTFNARARAYSGMSVADYLEGKRPMMDDGRRQVAEDPNVKATKEGNKTLEEILKEIKNAGLPSGGNGEKPAVPGGVFS